MDEPKGGNLSDEHLLRLGRNALWLEHYQVACEAFREYCDRLSHHQKKIPPTVLAYYGLALGHCQNVREGLRICLEALSADRRDPMIYLCLARLYVLAGSKRSAVDVITQGLRVRANHRGLKALRSGLGVRQSRPVPFLPRENAVNVRLGRVLKKLKGKIGPAKALA